MSSPNLNHDLTIKTLRAFNGIVNVLNLLGFVFHLIGSFVMFFDNKKSGFFTVFKYTLTVTINLIMLFVREFREEKRTSSSIRPFKLMNRFVLAAMFIGLIFLVSELITFVDCHKLDANGFANPHCVNPHYPDENLPNFGFLLSLMGMTICTSSSFLFFILINTTTKHFVPQPTDSSQKAHKKEE